MTTPQSAQALAEWLSTNEPDLFAELTRIAASEAAKLGGFTDILAKIGNSATAAVKAVGGYLSSSKGIDTLTSLGATYLGYKQQTNVLQTQVALAQAGLPPAPITNVQSPVTGGIVPVYTPTNTLVDQSILARLQPSVLQRYGLPVALGAGVLALIFFLRR